MLATPKCAFITLKLSHISQFPHKSIHDESNHHVWINNCRPQGTVAPPSLLGSVCKGLSTLRRLTLTRNPQANMLLSPGRHTVYIIKGICMAAVQQHVPCKLGCRLSLKSRLCPSCVNTTPCGYINLLGLLILYLLQILLLHHEFLRWSVGMYCWYFGAVNVFYESVSWAPGPLLIFR